MGNEKRHSGSGTDKRSRKVHLITLGCAKNQVDSEWLVTQLGKAGYELEVGDGAEEAHAAIINTCGFIDRAKEESIEVILGAVEDKRAGKYEEIYVTGCLVNRYRDQLREEIPEVDGFYDSKGELLERFGVDPKVELIGERHLLNPRHYAYVKIAEGCSRSCAFCAIPQIRGRHVSRPMEAICAEVEALVASGTREVILISQELTYYGVDLYRRRALKELLEQLVAIDGLEWIRMHYLYPARFPMEILDLMAQEPKLCAYLDIPFQHADDGMLRRMQRRTTRAEMERILQRARELMPHIALRSGFIVGFPGETDQQFHTLLEFVRQWRFDALGIFTYSHEEGTAAYDYEDDVPPEVKVERYNALHALQAEISHENCIQRIGQRMRVLIDGVEGDVYYGHHEGASPEIDVVVYVHADEPLNVGQFYEVEIVSADYFALDAVLARPKSEAL